MSHLTGKDNVDEKTMVIINGTEVLTDAGIKGKINRVGVGFGTGRHGAARNRKPDKIEPVPPPKPLRTPTKTQRTMKDSATDPRIKSMRNKQS